MKTFLNHHKIGFARALSRRGFTILEVVVAISVIITGVIAGLTLTTYNLNTAAASDMKLIAANLARESLEITRQVRDSNWLAGNAWFKGLTDLDSDSFITDFDSANNLWSLEKIDTEIADCDQCRLYLDEASGIYSHAISNKPTVFKRLVSLRQICWQDAVGDEIVLAAGLTCQAQSQELAGVEIHSLVTWTEVGQVKELEAVDRLYNWR